REVAVRTCITLLMVLIGLAVQPAQAARIIAFSEDDKFNLSVTDSDNPNANCGGGNSELTDVCQYVVLVPVFNSAFPNVPSYQVPVETASAILIEPPGSGAETGNTHCLTGDEAALVCSDILTLNPVISSTPNMVQLTWFWWSDSETGGPQPPFVSF